MGLDMESLFNICSLQRLQLAWLIQHLSLLEHGRIGKIKGLMKSVRLPAKIGVRFFWKYGSLHEQRSILHTLCHEKETGGLKELRVYVGLETWHLSSFCASWKPFCVYWMLPPLTRFRQTRVFQSDCHNSNFKIILPEVVSIPKRSHFIPLVSRVHSSWW